VRETYTIDMVRGDRRSGTRTRRWPAAGGATEFDKPVDNIGDKSFRTTATPMRPAHLRREHPGCGTGARVRRPAQGALLVNLGKIFDLVNLKARTEFAERRGRNKNDLANKNVSSIELEVPVACLTAGTDPVIGGWTTASMRQGRLLNPTPGSRHQRRRRRKAAPGCRCRASACRW
jgi:hypothetical protein